MSQALTLTALPRDEYPRVSEIKKYLRDPRNGGIAVYHQIIIGAEEWLTCHESEDETWSVTHFGPLVVASRITFLMGMKWKDGGG